MTTAVVLLNESQYLTMVSNIGQLQRTVSTYQIMIVIIIIILVLTLLKLAQVKKQLKGMEK